MPNPEPDTGPAPLPPARSRLRIGLLLLILALHAGFYLMLKNGLLAQLAPAMPSNVVMAVIFPPELPAAPAPQASVPLQPRQQPPAVKPRPVPPKPKPLAKTAPEPEAPARPQPVPAAPPSGPDAQAAAPLEAVPQRAAPAAPPTPAVPKTITSGAQYLQPPQPEYPAQSRRLGEEGRVILRVLLDEGGRVGQVMVQKSSGFPRLDDAAVDAVRRARFKPHLEDGKPLAVYVTVPISFKLDQ